MPDADGEEWWLDVTVTPRSLLQLLDDAGFARVCADLLVAQGMRPVVDAKAADLGVDGLYAALDNARVLIEVRRQRWPIQQGHMSRTIQRLERAKTFLGVERALLMLGFTVGNQERAQYTAARPWLSILDVREIDRELGRHPAAQSAASSAIESKLAEVGRGSSGYRNAGARPTRAKELLRHLASVSTGRSGWRDYEDVVVDILNFVFSPALGVPVQQSRSDDGLDIRDAIYPIRRDHTFWSDMRTLCRTRFLVVESKHHEAPPGQREVESLQQYLYVKAMRMLGVLVTPLPPSDSARKARRRAWLEFDKLILFLSNDDLAQLVEARECGGNPEDLLDAQLDEFFGSLVA